MVAPLVAGIAVKTAVNTITETVGLVTRFFRGIFGYLAATQATTTTPSTTTVLVTRISQVARKVFSDDDDENVKSLRTTTPISNVNGSSLIGVILILVIIAAVVAFIIYRKRSKSKEINFRQSYRANGSPPSPPVSQSEQNRSSLWSNKNSGRQKNNFNLV